MSKLPISLIHRARVIIPIAFVLLKPIPAQATDYIYEITTTRGHHYFGSSPVNFGDSIEKSWTIIDSSEIPFYGHFVDEEGNAISSLKISQVRKVETVAPSVVFRLNPAIPTLLEHLKTSGTRSIYQREVNQRIFKKLQALYPPPVYIPEEDEPRAVFFHENEDDPQDTPARENPHMASCTPAKLNENREALGLIHQWVNIEAGQPNDPDAIASLIGYYSLPIWKDDAENDEPIKVRILRKIREDQEKKQRALEGDKILASYNRDQIQKAIHFYRELYSKKINQDQANDDRAFEKMSLTQSLQADAADREKLKGQESRLRNSMSWWNLYSRYKSRTHISKILSEQQSLNKLIEQKRGRIRDLEAQANSNSPISATAGEIDSLLKKLQHAMNKTLPARPRSRRQ